MKHSIWVDFFRGEDSKRRHYLHNLIHEEEEIGLADIILTEIL